MFKKLVVLSAMLLANSAMTASAGTQITGNIESKCVITTDSQGVYGNPTTDVLSTLPADGGVMPLVRFDILEGSTYKGVISYPIDFTTSPALNDVVNWTGSAELVEMSDTTMSVFETSKVQYENVTEFDLTLSGSAWFKVGSTATYGYGKSFPGGTYRATIETECIAK